MMVTLPWSPLTPSPPRTLATGVTFVSTPTIMALSLLTRPDYSRRSLACKGVARGRGLGPWVRRRRAREVGHDAADAPFGPL